MRRINENATFAIAVLACKNVYIDYHVKAAHMGFHVSVCLPVALFLVYMVTHGASPRYYGASPNRHTNK